MSIKRLSWGIIGTGVIAKKFASELPHSRTGHLAAVGSRTRESAGRFADMFPGTRPHGSYEELLADADVEAVYIATPHPDHPRLTILAAEAGKHVLCEKPAALNRADAVAAIEAARRHRVHFMEAFMYRCHPRTARIAELIAGGAIGTVKFIEATFSFCFEEADEDRVFAPQLGGGGILDVGCYTTSIARMVAGAAAGKPVAEPVKVAGAAILAPTGVDAVATALLEFPGGIYAQLACGVALERRNDLLVQGDNGSLAVREFWNPPGPIQIFNPDGTLRETVETDSNPYKYAIEADAFADSIDAPERTPVTIEDTLGNMETLDRWREEVQVFYPAEGASARTHS